MGMDKVAAPNVVFEGRSQSETRSVPQPQKLAPWLLRRLTPLRRAQEFPKAASFKIALPNSASERPRLSRAFSFSSSLSFPA